MKVNEKVKAGVKAVRAVGGAAKRDQLKNLPRKEDRALRFFMMPRTLGWGAFPRFSSGWATLRP